MVDYFIHFGYLLLASYIFWCLYIATMGCYRAHLAGRLVGITKILAYPLVIFAVIVDIIFQYTVATVLFFDLPKAKEYLVTDRLQRYVAGKNDWRRKIAVYICDNLLDVFDPTGDHC